ncbi:UNVERIFIED_ORG: hypothetical protein [Escherichia phage CMSTMSU]
MATEISNYAGTDMPLPVTDYDRNTISTSTQDKYANVPIIAGLKNKTYFMMRKRVLLTVAVLAKLPVLFMVFPHLVVTVLLLMMVTQKKN